MRRRTVLAAALLACATAAARAQQPAPADTLMDLRRALGACLAETPLAAGSRVTIAFTMKRDGSIFGRPRITYARLEGDAEARGRFLDEAERAVDSCLPVRVTPALGAAIAANFFFANVLLIPSTLALLYGRSELKVDHEAGAIVLMIVGTIIAASIGRVFYQVALTATGGDNGFVTMFFNLVPALTALISFAMSWRISALHFAFDTWFFVGLALIGVSLAHFTRESFRQPAVALDYQAAARGCKFSIWVAI